MKIFSIDIQSFKICFAVPLAFHGTYDDLEVKDSSGSALTLMHYHMKSKKLRNKLKCCSPNKSVCINVTFSFLLGFDRAVPY